MMMHWTIFPFCFRFGVCCSLGVEITNTGMVDLIDDVDAHSSVGISHGSWALVGARSRGRND